LLLASIEVVGARLDEHVELFERAFVQQEVDPFARRQLAFGVLASDPPLAAAQPRVLAPRLKFFQDVLHARSYDVTKSAYWPGGEAASFRYANRLESRAFRCGTHTPDCLFGPVR